MSGAENAVNGVPAAGRMPADGNQASPSLPPDAVQLDKLMVDILSGQVVNYSWFGTVMRPKPALAMRRWNSTAAYRRWTTRSGLAFGAVLFLDGHQDRQKRTERQAAGEPDANAGHEQHAAALAVAHGDEDGLTAALVVRWNTSDRIKDIPAATNAGRRAKAGVAVVLLHENGAAESTSGDKSFAYAALLDISGRTAA